ncbi:MAG: Ig-like domain-containing protein [Myxococcaceae bacterium]
MSAVALTLSACNDDGDKKDSGVVILDTAPMVSLAASNTDVTAAGDVSLIAVAVDDGAIAKVEFYEGATLVSTATMAPYAHVVTYAIADNGSHSYTAKAYDSGSKSTTSAAVTVNVNISSGSGGGAGGGGGSATGGGAATGGGGAATGGGGAATGGGGAATGGGSASGGGGGSTDGTPPVVTLVAAMSTVATAQAVNVTATATDNVAVAKVELYDGFAKIGELGAPTVNSDYVFTFNYTVADNGTHRYLARAYDAAANYSNSAIAQVDVQIPPASPIKEIAAAAGYTWLLKQDGTLYVTGGNVYGTTGGNNYPIFSIFPGVTAHEIGAMPASSTMLFTLPDDSVAAIGSNGYAVGFNPTSTAGFQVITPSSPLLTNARYVRGGEYTSCFIKTDDTIWCAGYDYAGPFTNNGQTATASEVLFNDGGVFTNAATITLGYEGRGILRKDGTVWAFGRNDLGQGEIGDGTNVNRFGAVQVIYPSLAPVVNATQVVSARGAAFALLDGGTVVGWGSNYQGLLGDNTAVSFRGTANAVYALTNIVELAAGYDHVLALDDQSNLWAWGSNTYGQLGSSGPGTSSNVPVQVPNMTGVAHIYAGSFTSFALMNNGELWGWGGNGGAALGIADAGSGAVRVPQQIYVP